jgi:hypothetical protein
MLKNDYESAAEKNTWLKENRSISFEEIIAAIEVGNLLEVIEHPNQVRYPKQKM